MRNIELKMPRLEVAVAVIRNTEGQILISQRAKNVHQGGLWEFPGGKFEVSEDASQALARELKEELDINILFSTPLINIRFNYPDLKVHLHVRQVDSFKGKAVGREGQVIRWVFIKDLERYAFPEANKPILSALSLPHEYAIINSSNREQVGNALELLAQQGVSLVQIRAKAVQPLQVDSFIKEVSDKCDQLGIRCLFNSSLFNTKVMSSTVHFTALDLMSLKKRPGGYGMYAASCHNLQELQHAEKLGLDFVVLSPVQLTSSHLDAQPLGWQLFTDWVSQINIPVFSLGGMTKEDKKQAVQCGGQGVAGISLFNLK